MQLKISLKSQEPAKFRPIKGMTVGPICGKLVPSHSLCGWEIGMVYKVTPGTEIGVDECVIKGIVRGREYTIIEYSDNIQEKP